MAREKKKIIDIKLIIGILFLLILLVGASYAYFAVEVNSNNYNKTVVTGSTEGVAIASIQNPTTKLNLNVDGSAMSLDNLGTIYADDEDNYVKTKSEGFHDIGVITLTNSKKDDNIYRCTANVTITVDNGVNSILPVLEQDDLKVFLRWGTNHKVIDLSTLQNTNGKTTIPISLDIVGNNSKSIETYIELTNKETDQSYISGKDINIDIDTTDLKCELTGERAVYLVSTGYNNQYGAFRSEEWAQYIKNIYFVDYINTESVIKTWDLTNVGTGKNQSPAGSIIGWLEEISKETDEEEQYYDLYIGSKDRIYSLNISYFFSWLSNLENIVFGNFYSDLNSNVWRCFVGSASLDKLDVSKLDTATIDNFSEFGLGIRGSEFDVSNFNTKKVTTAYGMFSGLSRVTKLDVSNFNTMKVTIMGSMFHGMSSLTELDVSSFYTGNVTNMNSMFRDLSQIKELDLSSFDTRKVTIMANMFCGMSSLEYLDLRNAEFSQVTSYGGMFSNVKNGITIIVKDEENRSWIEARLKEAGRTGNVLLPSELDNQ